MLLLVLLPLAGLHLVQLLADCLVPVVLSAHFQPFIQHSKAAFSLDDFAAQIVIGAIHRRDFFIKFLHGIDAVALQKRQQFGVLLESLNLAGTGTGLILIDFGLGFIKPGHKAIPTLGYFNRCLLLRPVINPGDTGLEFFQQFVVCDDLAVDVPFLCLDALSLHLTGGNAHVN